MPCCWPDWGWSGLPCAGIGADPDWYFMVWRGLQSDLQAALFCTCGVSPWLRFVPPATRSGVNARIKLLTQMNKSIKFANNNIQMNE